MNNFINTYGLDNHVVLFFKLMLNLYIDTFQLTK